MQRIFKAFADGVSPKTICKMLNAEQIPGPRLRILESEHNPRACSSWHRRVE